TIAADGDLKPGTDVFMVDIASKEDEQRIARLAPDKPVMVTTRDWTIIPLENLIAQRQNIFLEVATLADARTALAILERGVDGIVINNRDEAELRKIIAALKEEGEQLCLAEAAITRVLPLTMGDRVCIDTCSSMGLGEGMLIGNSSSGMFLVHAESIENPYVAPRPFRVNAGPVHAYVRVPGGTTRYLSELKAGDPVLIVTSEGKTEQAVVGRVKIEKRPLVFIEAVVKDRVFSAILQNAETVRLTAPGGTPVSVVELSRGTKVLVLVEAAGRHFGMKVEESIEEK
ncbi:MAG: 3-dehydroquinate synthase II, partial [Proteobacteria bacterium]|nr:3-dehydroquinate synthase II [Pseudomonadota bacterium]